MLTPLDIENKKFSKQVMNGYNVEDVDDFLDELVIDYEKNYKELAEANLKIENITNELEHYKKLETTLQNTLIMAQSTAEEVKKVAQNQSNQIIEEAKLQAEQIINNAKIESESITNNSQEEAEKTVKDLQEQIEIKENKLEEIKKQFDVYIANMESTLLSQEEWLKKISEANN